MLSQEHKMKALRMPKRKYPNDKEKIVDIDIKDNINIFIDKGYYDSIHLGMAQLGHVRDSSW